MPSPFPIPLNALRAIEIVARRGALAPAAEELGVTVGAVSQHIRRAEARLGVELFARTPQGLVPQPVLAEVLGQLTAGFATLADAVTYLRQSEGGVLNLTVGSVFASRWLIWRVNSFTARHPDIELRLVVTGQMLDLNRADIDCAIRYGRGSWPGVTATPIGGFTYRPVVAPQLAGAIKAPEDLLRIPIVRDEIGMVDWGEWWRAAGVTPPATVSGPVYFDPSLAFDAAISGQGVLLAVDMMSADAVCDGRLVRPLDITVESEMGYFLCIADTRRPSPKVRAFAEWLKEAVPASAGGYLAEPGLVVHPPSVGR
jgi:DNA-binding transcriptional LysR family regulator